MSVMSEVRNSKIKTLSQSIIEDFTHYVQTEVKKGRVEYLKTGIDNDLVVYREFFLNILGLSLGLKDYSPNVDTVVKQELMTLIKRDLSYCRYKKIISVNRAMIYRTCEVIFDKVVEGIINEGLIETK